MALAIGSFSNASGGGSVFFKAAGHPLCLEAARNIVCDTDCRMFIYHGAYRKIVCV